MKHFLSILLSVCILMTAIAAVSIPAYAEEADLTVSGETEGDYEYEYSRSKAVITKYTGSAAELVIPSTLGGYPVTQIGYNAFSDCTSLESVTIPDSVTRIDGYAFSSCTSLESVTIPDSVTSIGSRAFDDTAWYNNQPDSVVYAGKVAYTVKGECPASVTLKDGTVSISDWAFSDCTSLESVTIPDSVAQIGEFAFSDCTSLESLIIPDSVTEISWHAFSGCTSLESLIIPDSVTQIEQAVFSRCTSLKSVIIPDSVTEISWHAFEDCTALESVTIPDSVMSIGRWAFQGCTALESVTIGSSVWEIGMKAFYNTAWYNNQPDGIVYAGKVVYTVKGECPASVTLRDGTLGIGESAFERCASLESVTIPDSVTRIDGYAFSGCKSLESVTIPDSVTSIGSRAFDDTAWYNTWYNNQPDGVVYAGKVAYTVKGVCPASVTLRDGTLGIGDYAFDRCTSLESVTIPDSVTTIGIGAFRDCKSLESVTIPDSVTTIGNTAFGYRLHNYGYEYTIEGFTIRGYRDTAAEKYANDRGFTFIALEEQPTEKPTEKPTEASPEITLGDTDGDGTVSVLDATRIQKFKASLCNLDGTKFDGTQPTAAKKQAADVDKDGVISVLDATRIQKYKAHLCSLDGTVPYHE